MATVTAVLSALVSSVVDLVVLFVTVVATHDPLAGISWLVGAAVTTATLAYFGYLALGGIVAAVRDAF